MPRQSGSLVRQINGHEQRTADAPGWLSGLLGLTVPPTLLAHRQLFASAVRIGTARRQISRRWRAATSMPMWRPAGPETPLPAQPCHRRSRPTNRRASKPCAQRSRPGHASPYRLRKQLPEPVFGQIKQARGFRQFLLRGFEKVRAEWAIICTVHNLLKLALVKLAHRRNLSAALPPALAAR